MDTPTQNQKVSTSEEQTVIEKPQRSRKSLLFFGILGALVLIILVTGAYYLGANNATKKSVVSEISPTTKPTMSEDVTANWKTYTNSDINLKLSYPENWKANELSDAGKVDGVTLSGPEGNIRAVWGSGFGGGCDASEHQSMLFFGKQTDICYGVGKDGSAGWNQLYQKIDSNTTLSVTAESDPPKSNTKLIEKILSTFMFNSMLPITDVGNGMKELKSTKYPVSYKFPSNWKYYVDTYAGGPGELFVPNKPASPTSNEFVTDGNGCAFYLGSHGGGDGPSKFLVDKPLTIDNISFTDRAWSKTENGTPFFHSYVTSNSLKISVIWSFISKNKPQQCQNRIDGIISTIKFTQ